MKSLLIIGGSGFFGKSILDAFKRNLLSQWDISSISIISRQATQLDLDCFGIFKNRVQLIDGDLSSITILPYADYVIHAAASTDIRRYEENPIVESGHIINSTKNFCKLARKFLKNSKILFISSGAVYGKQPENIKNISESYTDFNYIDLPLSKKSYAEAKLMSEQEIIKLGDYDIRSSIARCFSFVGPWLPLNLHFAVGNFFLNSFKKKKIIINSKNEVIRSYMYADDLVIWLMNIIDDSQYESEYYNVGSDQPFEIREIARKLDQIFGVENQYNKVDNNIDIYVPDTSKIKRKFRIMNAYDIDSSLNETIKKIKKYQIIERFYK